MSLDTALEYSAHPDTPVAGIMEPQLAQHMLTLRYAVRSAERMLAARLRPPYPRTPPDEMEILRDLCRSLLAWEPTRPLLDRRRFRCPRCETEHNTMSGAEACSLSCAGQGIPRRD